MRIKYLGIIGFILGAFFMCFIMSYPISPGYYPPGSCPTAPGLGLNILYYYLVFGVCLAFIGYCVYDNALRNED